MPAKRPFDPEGGSGESSSDSESHGEQPTNSFNFGWSQLHKAAKAHFSENLRKVQKPSLKKKRPYDNSKREAMASYKRSGASGAKLKENGRSAKRILNILSKDTCLCALELYQCISSRFLFGAVVRWCSVHWSR